VNRRRAGRWRDATLLCALVLVGCSAQQPADPRAQADAQKLVSAAQSAGVAPELTVEVAEALYGTTAPQICGALAGGISSAESLLLNGNPAGRRVKLITDRAITYERLVVQNYCPDDLPAYDQLVAHIDATEVTR